MLWTGIQQLAVSSGWVWLGCPQGTAVWWDCGWPCTWPVTSPGITGRCSCLQSPRHGRAPWHEQEKQKWLKSTFFSSCKDAQKLTRCINWWHPYRLKCFLHCLYSTVLFFSANSLLFCTQTNLQYLAGVVLDAEAIVWQAVVVEELWILAEATLKVLVFSTDGVQFVQEGLVGDCPRPQALLVQHGQDAILVLDITR